MPERSRKAAAVIVPAACASASAVSSSRLQRSPGGRSGSSRPAPRGAGARRATAPLPLCRASVRSRLGELGERRRAQRAALEQRLDAPPQRQVGRGELRRGARAGARRCPRARWRPRAAAPRRARGPLRAAGARLRGCGLRAAPRHRAGARARPRSSESARSRSALQCAGEKARPPAVRIGTCRSAAVPSGCGSRRSARDRRRPGSARAARAAPPGRRRSAMAARSREPRGLRARRARGGKTSITLPPPRVRREDWSRTMKRVAAQRADRPLEHQLHQRRGARLDAGAPRTATRPMTSAAPGCTCTGRPVHQGLSSMAVSRASARVTGGGSAPATIQSPRAILPLPSRPARLSARRCPARPRAAGAFCAWMRAHAGARCRRAARAPRRRPRSRRSSPCRSRRARRPRG